MLPEKSMVTPRSNLDILEHSGGTEMWMWLYVEIGILLGFGSTVGKSEQKEIWCCNGYELCSSWGSGKG